jgi:hypothetical protein
MNQSTSSIFALNVIQVQMIIATLKICKSFKQYAKSYVLSNGSIGFTDQRDGSCESVGDTQPHRGLDWDGGAVGAQETPKPSESASSQ